MRRLVLGALLIASAPLAAQDIELHASSASRESTPMFGAGLSVGGSFRLGAILADTAWARKALLRIGARLSLTDHFRNEVVYDGCLMDAPCVGREKTVRMRIIQGYLFMLPYTTPVVRVELGAGGASYRFRGTGAETGAGLIGVAAVEYRVNPRAPFWLRGSVVSHGRNLFSVPADGASPLVPSWSFRLGVLARR